MRGRKIADELSIVVEIPVKLVRTVRLFADEGGGGEHDANPFFLHLRYQGIIERDELVRVRPRSQRSLVPDVVHPDEYYHHIRVTVQDVPLQSEVEVVHFVPADPGACKLEFAGGEHPAQLGDVPGRPHARLGDRISEKNDTHGRGRHHH